jgi:hypothetical protein
VRAGATVSWLIFRAANSAHKPSVAIITENEVFPMRHLVALALLFGIAFGAVAPASAYDPCPKYEGYPDCHNNR